MAHFLPVCISGLSCLYWKLLMLTPPLPSCLPAYSRRRCERRRHRRRSHPHPKRGTCRPRSISSFHVFIWRDKMEHSHKEEGLECCSGCCRPCSFHVFIHIILSRLLCAQDWCGVSLTRTSPTEFVVRWGREDKAAGEVSFKVRTSLKSPECCLRSSLIQVMR